MNKSFKHLPKDKRKKILLICDDIRVHSGVATVAKEVVIKTAHHFNWVQMAGAIKHPEVGKHLDALKSIPTSKKQLVFEGKDKESSLLDESNIKQ